MNCLKSQLKCLSSKSIAYLCARATSSRGRDLPLV
ncbi:hypothetical protein AB6A40_010789, partial [Gnathostoma spinigerum]